ncbi:hypothetical protein ZWY2020_027673 [Hordeum vulgare]|nr:hypothetical protein ZWY2020_027673 [Hordeum vulgare]
MDRRWKRTSPSTKVELGRRGEESKPTQAVTDGPTSGESSCRRDMIPTTTKGYHHAATTHNHAETPRGSLEPPYSDCGTPPKNSLPPGHGRPALHHPEPVRQGHQAPRHHLSRSSPPPASATAATQI